MTLNLSWLYKPRWYQKAFEDAMFSGKKKAILTWHRRSGKDIACFNFMAHEAALGKVGAYYYVFPDYSHAKKVIWDGMDEEGNRFLDFIPSALIAKKNEKDMRIIFVNGSYIQLLGALKWDSARGTNGFGYVFSEHAYMSSMMYEAVVRPILVKNGGWVVFNSTPQGRNHHYAMHNVAKKDPDEWFCSYLPNSVTHLVSEQAIDKLKIEGMSDEMIEQEFECSWDMGVRGAYYGRLMSDMEKEGRIGFVPYDKNLLVYTSWDLGFNDATAIIFFQKRGNEILIIDHYENRGFALSHYLGVVRSKPYTYGQHFAPHDGKAHHHATGSTFIQVAAESGFSFTVLEPRPVLEGIEMVRGILPRVFMDRQKCEYLIKCLLQYHSEYDENANVYRNRPQHDWASHSADAVRYMAQALTTIGLAGAGMTAEELREKRRKAMGIDNQEWF